MASAGVDAVAALNDIAPVSRETADRLGAFVALLRKWQPVENLVSAKTLPEVWRRHVADSGQLVGLFPAVRLWLDLGSGAGFPGLVVAIMGGSGTIVHLVESNRRKCAFLRQSIRETGAAAIVHEGRVEDVLSDWSGRVEMITARAVATLGSLFALAEPLMGKGVPAAFHKGEDFAREIAEATQSWEFDLVKHKSRIGNGGVILEISSLRRKPGAKRTSG
jgi:16S rRNA (guanine527-N7)-methyltransferase